MEKSSQIAWKIVPLGHFFPLKVVPLIEVLLYGFFGVKIRNSPGARILGGEDQEDGYLNHEFGGESSKKMSSPDQESGGREN
jgi:hypothetical protein